MELAGDPRYDADAAYARIQLRPLDRPFAGAEVAMAEAEPISRVIKTTFSLERFSGVDLDEIAARAERWVADDGIHFILADLPADDLAELARRMRDKPALILNVSAAEDDLRGKNCQPNLLHTIPSHAMQADTVAQYLVARKWPNVLVLQGSRPEDARIAAALRRSATRFGLKIVDVRQFQLTNDPRQREQSNVSLLTGGADYDVVFVADSDGEYGRYVPYQTLHPRPVVGTVGLVPDAWHWSWERNGGPQVSSRFEKRASHRMTGTDWAAWIAVKAIVQSALRTRSVAYGTNREFLLGDKMNLDGSKGNPMSFRSWDGQLRQPMLLVTQNAVIERAPIRGFLHQTNDLDTLGIDRPETQCRQ
ncbi:ABC transporter substrate-binding protein [Microvirga sp. M2]|uniref:ABC transporter substrate-binding protein n=1 Tax=Microvirga sp. M2 TaxID=3073270 RepID=UPI0039C2F74E